MVHNQLCFFGNKDKIADHAHYTITITDKNRELTVYQYPGQGKFDLSLSEEQYKAWWVEQSNTLKSKGGSIVSLSKEQDCLLLDSDTHTTTAYQSPEQYLVLESVYAPTWHPIDTVSLAPHSYIFFPVDQQAENDLKAFITQLSRFPEDRAQLILYCLRYSTIHETIQQLANQLDSKQPAPAASTWINKIMLGLSGLILILVTILMLKPEPSVVDYSQQLSELMDEVKKTDNAVGQLDAKVNNRFTNVRDRFDKIDRDLDLIFTSDLFKNQTDQSKTDNNSQSTEKDQSTPDQNTNR